MNKLPQYSGILNLNEQYIFQPIYYTQLYGTFIGVYCKFNGEKSADGFTLNNIHFRLINYKGIVNLGFGRFEEPKLITFNVDDDEFNSLYIKFEILAGDGFLEWDYKNQGYDFTIDFPIDSTIIYMDRRVRKISQHSSEENQLLNPIFDIEFNYREGVIVEQEERKFKPLKFEEVDKDVDKYKENNSARINLFNGGICPRSLNRLIYI